MSLLVAATVAAFIFREPLRYVIFARVVMHNSAPTQEAVQQVIEGAKDRQKAIQAFWDTQKIVPREVAIRLLSASIAAGQPLPAGLEPWIVGAALDPDMNVRETAMGILRDHKDPLLAAVCMAQVQNVDPQARLLGLDNLRPVPAAVGVPSVIPLLEDGDPLIVAKALKLLENWTGHPFGVKLSDIVPVENQKTGMMEYRQESKDMAKAGAERAKAWWAKHEDEFAAVKLEVPAAALAAREPVRAGDFSLSTLEGRPIRLSQLHGKVVLINFWTTWCTACIGEMPALVQLEERHHEHLVILGVSLDSVPDEDGDAAVHETAKARADNAIAAEERLSPAEIRKKVARTVKIREINYPIMIDEKNDAGGQYNGGELPTTVIVDADGNVRRRFIGARSLPVLEAMIAEASQTPR